MGYSSFGKKDSIWFITVCLLSSVVGLGFCAAGTVWLSSTCLYLTVLGEGNENIKRCSDSDDGGGDLGVGDPRAVTFRACNDSNSSTVSVAYRGRWLV